jgi:hypothetical protein
MLSITWQPLQSKVCNVEYSLNLNRMGKPQKGQRGRGASMSIPLVVKSKALIDGKEHQSKAVGRQCWRRNARNGSPKSNRH